MYCGYSPASSVIRTGFVIVMLAPPLDVASGDDVGYLVCEVVRKRQKRCLWNDEAETTNVTADDPSVVRHHVERVSCSVVVAQGIA